jgi:hypothetical protein
VSPNVAHATDYSLKLVDFLKDLCPDFQLPDAFSFLKDKTHSTLNLILKLTSDLYELGTSHLVDLTQALIHAINFYLGARNAKSFTELSIGFTSFSLTLFKFDQVKSASNYIFRIVSTFFDDLKKYFIKAESAEKMVKSFWSNASTSNPRTLFGIVHACSGIFTSVICIKTFVTKAYAEDDVYSLITALSTGIFKIGSELRQHAENVSIFLARVYDWIYINAENIIKMRFSEIKWELPTEQVFESKYVEMTDIINSFIEDPLYLEANNLTLELLRDRLNKLRGQGEQELNKNPTPSIKSSLARYLTVLDGHIRFIESKLNPNNTKPQPMAVTLLGSAGGGKSASSSKIGLMMQKLANRIPDETLINNRGGDPKFEENITNSTDVIIFDDYANDHSTKMRTKDILDIVNTSKELIPKASADEKGLHKYSNIGTIFTTNDEDLGMACFKTASKDSLLRRLGFVLELNIAEEYRLAGTDRLDLNHPDVCDEIFNTNVYEVNIKKPISIITTPEGRESICYQEIPYDRHPGNNSWRDAILKLQVLLDAEWSKNVARHAKSKSTEGDCDHCSLPKDMCVCGLHAEARKLATSRLRTLFFERSCPSPTECFLSMDNTVIDFTSSFAAKVSLFMFYCNLLAYAKHRFSILYPYRYTFLILCIISSFLPGGILVVLGLFVWYEYRHIRSAREEMVERNIRNRNAISEHYRTRCTMYAMTVMGSMLILGSIFTTSIFAAKVFAKSEDKSVTIEESDEVLEVSFTKPKEKSNSDAIGHYITKPRPAHEARTMTPSQALQEIGKGIAQVTITSKDGTMTKVKTLPMGSERLIPRHALPSTDLMSVELQISGVQGASYQNIDVPRTHVSDLTKHGILTKKVLDASLVHLPNAPPGKDFTKYFAEVDTIPTQAGCVYVHKDCDTGSFELIQVRARLLPKPIRYQTNAGFETQLVYECETQSHSSSDGDCGQPLIYNNAIIGIHIAGTGSNKFYCLAVDRSTIHKANAILKNEASIFVASTPPQPVLKRNLRDLSIVDQPSQYVQETLEVDTTPIVSLGTVLDVGGSIYKPRAEDYYFRNGNKQVEAEFGPLSSRPPKFVNGSKQINTTLAKFNTPKMQAPIALMDRAMDDWMYATNASGVSVSSYAASLEEADPGFFSVRSLQEALDGDGTGIVRGMNNNTSSGVCYGGTKKKHMMIDSLGMPIVPRILADYVEEDILALEAKWRAGEGTFDPFVRASKTNEVLPLEKAYEKTRSVYGNDMSYFIAATRGIIPIKHVLRNSKVSGCFVGLAAQSAEWEELHDHLTNGGAYTKFVCGDFSGYDTQLPKSLLEKAAACIVQLYRENGASSSDLEYLRGLLSSVVSPVMIWEGNLLQFCNGQPSGQPLTVEMNSIINSLLLRMAFFTIMDEHYPEIKDPKFGRFVKDATYGDDNAMGVSDEIPLFNHTTIQAVFASWGIKYTMADKGADSVPYQTIEEVSFLKRSFRYHPQLESIVAPLEEESLSKKFYWWTKSKNTPLTFPEQFQANFESQAREAYLHGEEFYSEFCAKCERIVLASQDGDERFVLPWNTIQPLSCSRMCSALKDAYFPGVN